MSKAEQGKLIVSAAKSLKRYSVSDLKISAFLHAASKAGRVGLFAAALRYNEVPFESATVLAANEGFSPVDLKKDILPWLEQAGICQLDKQNGAVTAVRSVMLSFDNILSAVSDYYGTLDPTDEDRGCIHALKVVSSLPRPESEVIQTVAKVIGNDEKARTAVGLAQSYKIVDSRAGTGLREPMLFSPKVWSGCIDRAGKALSSLSAHERAIIEECIDRVRQYQGMPSSLLMQFGKSQNAEHCVNLAINLHLISETRIEMASGSARTFLTTPHFENDLADTFGEDNCDRVKIFLDSIRNGQHFGDSSTGRIVSPEVLLDRFLKRGIIGSCSAIGTDYVTSEKAGIVRVKRDSPGSSRYNMELVQRDTVQKVYDIITTGKVAVGGRQMTASHIREGVAFRSQQECVGQLAELPRELAEAERAIILKLREGT
jgi:hypothetical protein